MLRTTTKCEQINQMNDSVVKNMNCEKSSSM